MQNADKACFVPAQRWLEAEDTGSSSAVVSSILQNRRKARKEHSGDIENGWSQEFCVLLTF